MERQIMLIYTALQDLGQSASLKPVRISHVPSQQLKSAITDLIVQPLLQSGATPLRASQSRFDPLARCANLICFSRWPARASVYTFEL